MLRPASNHVVASGRHTHLKSRQVFNESDGQKENECYDPVQIINRIVHMTWLPIHWFLLPGWLTRIDTPSP